MAGWVDGSMQVEGGFGHGRYLEEALGNKDVRYMSAEQLKFTKKLWMSRSNLQTTLRDEACLSNDSGNPLRKFQGTN